MNLLTENVKKIYFNYLIAAFGSALITSIYSVVDMAMVGQYQGPQGTAALAVVAPIWNIIYSLGLLMGIGGSVLYVSEKAQRDTNLNTQQYFTASLIGSVTLAIFSWLALILFKKELLILFGGSGELIDLALQYMQPILFVLPAFLFNQMLAAWLRNDNDPKLATAAVLAGGIFNVFGDYFFVFICNMGIKGAGLATALGSIITFIIMMTHFFKKKNTLKLIKPKNTFNNLKMITITGFSTFFIDIAMGILTVLFNRQIMKYLGSNALSIYGPIINVSTIVQCSAYSIGQASQPLISANYGACQYERIKVTLRYALSTALIFGIIWFGLSEIYPNLYIHIFMTADDTILAMAPAIIRKYALSFLILPINIFSTYYFQAIMQPKTAFIISITRGLLVSGILIMILPITNPDAIWYTMPLTELIVLLYVFKQMHASTYKFEQLIIADNHS